MSTDAEAKGYRRKPTVDSRGWVRVVELLAYGVHLDPCALAARGDRAKALRGTHALCTCGLDLAIDGAKPERDRAPGRPRGQHERPRREVAMPDRHFYRVSCPLCRETVFSAGPGCRIGIPADAPLFTVIAAATEDRVEIAAKPEPGGVDLVSVSHVCPNLRPPLTPDEQAELLARAIDFGARIAGEMFGDGGNEE